MNLETNLSNLKQSGQLRGAARNELVIQQCLENARRYHEDAGAVAGAQSRFLLAFEGIHAVGLAIMNHLQVSASERSTALVIAAQALDLEADRPNAIRIMKTLDAERNKIPPLVSMAIADIAMDMLEVYLDKGRAFVAAAADPDNECEGPEGRSPAGPR